MYADPQTITINAVPKTLNKLTTSEAGSKFATSTRDVLMGVSHSYGRRVRHTIRLQNDTLVANPLISGQNVSQSMSVYVAVDLPVGYDTAAAKQVTDGFIAYLAASSGSAMAKLIGGEA